MKVLLQKDVKDLGKVGDIVNVKEGFARNFLFPRRLAVKSSEKNVKEYNHLKKVAEVRRKKALSDRKELADQLKEITVSFSMAASETDKLFGSITAADVSNELAKLNFTVDKKDIQLEPIKVLGQHKVEIDFGNGITTEIAVSVERA